MGLHLLDNKETKQVKYDVVTTGWLCKLSIPTNSFSTCRIKVVNTDETEFEEKCFENPTYDGTSMIRVRGAMGPGVHGVPVLPVAAHKPKANDTGDTHAMDDAVNTSSPKTAGNGQILDREKINGKSGF